MTRTATRIIAGLSGLAAIAALSAVPAAADSNSMEEEVVYSNYHRAIRAAELCEDREFGMTDHERMGEVIDQKVHYALGAGKRLTLIERAKGDMWDMVFKDGCDDPAVQESLNLFHTELEPSLSM
jgi:hypothetical protein